MAVGMRLAAHPPSALHVQRAVYVESTPMTDSFAPTQALLRECLEYPGQTLETLRGVVSVTSASMIASWLKGETTPKRPSDWAVFQRRLETHLGKLTLRGADANLCDSRWAERFRAYCTERKVTPESVAAEVGANEWHGRRWHRWGEVPLERYRGAVARTVGYDFDASTLWRAVSIAAREFRQPFPKSLHALHALVDQEDARLEDFHRVIHGAIVAARTRGGVTSRRLAHHVGSTKACVTAFSARSAEQLNYSAPAIAAMLVGLAKYTAELDAQQVGEGSDGIQRALEELRARPKPPVNAPTKGRTTVRWDRIESTLGEGSHRLLRYRCPNGEFAAVVLVRFCIACEQSRKTTAELVAATGLKENRLSSWLNGRRLPDEQMLGRLQHALERVEGKRAARAVPSREDRPLLRPKLPLPTAAARPVPPVDPLAVTSAPVPTEGAADILIGVASTLRGVRAMRRAGWDPGAMERGHLITIARSAMEIGGLTPEDLKSKPPVAASGDGSAAVAAVQEVLPNLRPGTPKANADAKRRS